MARLSELPEWEREHHLEKIRDLPDFGPTPWAEGPPLARRRVALVTTAGLQRRDDIPFQAGSADYRIIPADTPSERLTITHDYYDHTDAERDLNILLPLGLFRELAQGGRIGALATCYSFMGHIEPPHVDTLLGVTAPQVAGKLKQQQVDAALLTPA